VGFFIVYKFVYLIILNNMTNEEKARLYSKLMSDFDNIRNRIADIKVTQVNLTEEQENQIKILQNQQQNLLLKINQLLK
jgi:hypothetical protein